MTGRDHGCDSNGHGSSVPAAERRRRGGNMASAGEDCRTSDRRILPVRPFTPSGAAPTAASATAAAACTVSATAGAATASPSSRASAVQAAGERTGARSNSGTARDRERGQHRERDAGAGDGPRGDERAERGAVDGAAAVGGAGAEQVAGARVALERADDHRPGDVDRRPRLRPAAATAGGQPRRERADRVAARREQLALRRRLGVRERDRQPGRQRYEQRGGHGERAADVVRPVRVDAGQHEQPRRRRGEHGAAADREQARGSAARASSLAHLDAGARAAKPRQSCRAAGGLAVRHQHACGPATAGLRGRPVPPATRARGR